MYTPRISSNPTYLRHQHSYWGSKHINSCHQYKVLGGNSKHKRRKMCDHLLVTARVKHHAFYIHYKGHLTCTFNHIHSDSVTHTLTLYTLTHSRVCTFTQMCVHFCLLRHTYTDAHQHSTLTHTHTHTHTCKHTHTQTHTHTHTHTHTYRYKHITTHNSTDRLTGVWVKSVDMFRPKLQANKAISVNTLYQSCLQVGHHELIIIPVTAVGRSSLCYWRKK